MVNEKSCCIYLFTQDIHQQLRDRTNECQALKQQMEDYTMHVGRVEEMLAQKEVEKEELLVQYKSLNSKAIELESNAQQSEDDHEHAKQDLLHCQQVPKLFFNIFCQI